MNHIVDAIVEEQDRRRRLEQRRKPYHYWQERGDKEPPREEHWCDYCVGFFGVPHQHDPKHLCLNIHRARPGERMCACIDCVVAERVRRG